MDILIYAPAGGGKTHLAQLLAKTHGGIVFDATFSNPIPISSLKPRIRDSHADVIILDDRTDPPSETLLQMMQELRKEMGRDLLAIYCIREFTAGLGHKASWMPNGFVSQPQGFVLGDEAFTPEAIEEVKNAFKNAGGPQVLVHDNLGQKPSISLLNPVDDLLAQYRSRLESYKRRGVVASSVEATGLAHVISALEFIRIDQQLDQQIAQEASVGTYDLDATVDFAKGTTEVGMDFGTSEDSATITLHGDRVVSVEPYLKESPTRRILLNLARSIRSTVEKGGEKYQYYVRDLEALYKFMSVESVTQIPADLRADAHDRMRQIDAHAKARELVEALVQQGRGLKAYDALSPYGCQNISAVPYYRALEVYNALSVHFPTANS